MNLLIQEIRRQPLLWLLAMVPVVFLVQRATRTLAASNPSSAEITASIGACESAFRFSGLSRMIVPT